MSKTIDDILQEMAKHTAEKPRHGINCACKDEWTLEGKKRLLENPQLYNELLEFCARVRNDNWLMVRINERLGTIPATAGSDNSGRDNPAGW